MKPKKSNNKTKLSRQTRKSNVPNTKMQVSKVFDENGESREVFHILQESKDVNFERIFLAHIIEAIEEIGNKKIELLMYLFSVKNSENMIIKTQAEIHEETGISKGTITATLNSLMDKNFIHKKSSGVYMINPDMIFKGSASKRMDILLTYKEISNEKQSQTEETQVSENPDVAVITDKSNNLDGSKPENWIEPDKLGE